MSFLHNLIGIMRVVTQRQRSYLGLVMAMTAGFVVAGSAANDLTARWSIPRLVRSPT